jgi:hypothetical protein
LREGALSIRGGYLPMDGVPGLSPVAGCRQSGHILRTDWMSALPPKADIGTELRNVRFVPKADKVRRSK